ncbi:MAG: PP2C family serine/threonine-protein phosphatase [Vulcanimicrobiota bacterium]
MNQNLEGSIHVAGASLPGAREYNDDHFCIADKIGQEQTLTVRVDRASAWFERMGLLVAVADGMGSYQGGSLASRTALETLIGVFYRLPEGSLRSRVELSLEASLQRLQATLRLEKKRKAGTTLAGFAAQPPDQLILFHIGDSGVVRLRGDRMSRLTVDHTPIGRPLAEGKMTLKEAVTRKDAHQLTRSMGLIGDTRVEIRDLDYAPGDYYLLMTDGVCSPGRGLSPGMLKRYVSSNGFTPEALLGPMLKKATANDGDNATLVLVQFD